MKTEWQDCIKSEINGYYNNGVTGHINGDLDKWRAWLTISLLLLSVIFIEWRAKTVDSATLYVREIHSGAMMGYMFRSYGYQWELWLCIGVLALYVMVFSIIYSNASRIVHYTEDAAIKLIILNFLYRFFIITVGTIEIWTLITPRVIDS